MATKVLLITCEEIKAASIIDENVDGLILSKTIDDVQQIHLIPILGIDLFNALCISVANLKTLKTPMSDTNKGLWNVIKPYLLNKVVAEFIIPSTYKITNKGIEKLTDASSANVSAADINELQNSYQNISTTYKTNLINYLHLNSLIASNVITETEITGDATGWFFGR